MMHAYARANPRRSERADGPLQSAIYALKFSPYIDRAQTCGIFSSCASWLQLPGERLMWAHYADNHRGVCLTYSIPTAFIRDTLIGGAPVVYGDEGLLNALQELDLFWKPTSLEADIKPVILTLLTTKAPEWAYECEARLVASAPGAVHLDRSWLKQVCFGLNTSHIDQWRVMEAIRINGYGDCCFARMSRAEGGLFELERRPMDQ